MIMEKLNNPHVYPSTQIDWNESTIQNRTVYLRQEEGITLRDYFANSAMQAFTSVWYEDAKNTPESIAKKSYKLADAMLKQREL
jgi:hypothetical protein